MKRQKFLTGLVILVLAGTLQAGLAWSQNDGHDPDPQWAREVRENIQQHSGMDAEHQAQMTANLDRCLAQGMNAEHVRALFPLDGMNGGDRAMEVIGHQERILGVGEDGLPIGPMMEKMHEGLMKHARAGMMDQVLTETAHNIRASDRVMRNVIDGGVQMSGHHGEMGEAVEDLSRCLWDGLHEEDMEHIGENARMRARDGSCELGEFVAANQAATRFSHSGMDRQRAVEMAGEALHNGYSAQDMLNLGDMMMAGTHLDGDHHEMMDSMGDWVHEGMSMDEMTEHMMEGGWMGPADMMGPGGSHPMNNMGAGGAGHDGGMGGDHGGGGGMGDDHGGGGMGGGDTGGGGTGDGTGDGHK